MNIKTFCAAAAVAVTVGAAADAAVLRFAFDATVLESRLYCEEGEGTCDESGPRNYSYSEGESGLAVAKVWSNMVSFTFMGDLLYEAELELNHNGYYRSVTVDLSSFASHFLEWDNNGGRFTYADDGYPAWESFHLDLDNPTMSAVPLPATAALLPMGIGALALMRRRRRAAI